MEQFTQLYDGFINALVKVLPTSPFQQYLAYFEDLPYLSWLNWFVPIRAGLVVMGAWLGAIALFYLYSIVLRWVKVIGD